jgi:catechol-2,3-dioxygenase
VKTRYQDSALFVASGDYRHIGLHTWQWLGAGPLPEDAFGLAEATVVLPHRAALRQIEAKLAAGMLGNATHVIETANMLILVDAHFLAPLAQAFCDARNRLASSPCGILST